MTPRLLPLAAVLLLALAATWLLTRDTDPRGGARGGSAASPTAVSPPDLGADDLAAASPRSPDATAAPPAADRAVATTAYEDELARATWVAGRVVFPPETPADERVRVIALGRSFEHGDGDHAVDVGPGGRFRVAFSQRTRTGRLALAATWLHLEEPVRVDLREPPEPAVLEPVLGGAIRGRVVPPPAADGVGPLADPARELVGRAVRLTGMRRSGAGAWTTGTEMSADLDASLEFEFHGLPTRERYRLTLDPVVFEPALIDELYLQPGVTAEHVLTVLRGVTVAGTVRDANGAPIDGAQVRAQLDRSWMFSRLGVHPRTAVTREGAFRIDGLAPGQVELAIGAQGFEDATLELGRLERGEERTDLAVVLSRGGGIRGVVLLPDGSPAAGAQVTVQSEDRGRPWERRDESVRADEQGAFAMTGLEPGLYRVDAHVVDRTRVTVKSRLTGRERERTVSTTLRAGADGVAAGSGDLVLRVSEGHRLAGRVVDDAGRAVPKVRIQYGRVTGAGAGADGVVRDYRHRKVDDEEGAFELEGLESGTWRLHATADGHLPAEAVEVAVPGGELAPIRLERAAVVRGVVLGPDGRPAPDATVEVRVADPARLGDPTLALGLRGRSTWSRMADREGGFELEGVPSGAVALRATCVRHAPSEPLELQVAPGGAAVEGVTLRLTAGVRLTGAVVDALGRGVPARLVELDRSRGGRGDLGGRGELGGGGDVWTGGGFDRSAQTGADGAFAFHGLAVGEYVLTTRPGPAELAGLGLDVDGVEELLERRETVDVGPQGAHVVLRPLDVTPVRLHGTVTAGGRPATARLVVHPYPDGPQVTTGTDAAGAYAIVLPGAGRYLLTILFASDAQESHTIEVGASGRRFDVEVPLGSVSGRVLGPDGPTAGVGVRAVRTADANGASSGGFAHTETDGEGRYAFDELPAGTWTLQAGGEHNTMVFFGKPRPSYLAQSKREGVVVGAGEAVRDVDLRLEAAGAVAVRTIDADGRTVAGMRVSARDADGGSETGYVHRTDAAGEVVLSGLRPGTYHLAAAGAAAGRATAGEVAVAVAANRTTDAELTVVPATVLRVRVTDLAGAPTEGHVTVTSADGVDLTDRRDWKLQHGAGPGEHAFGPLPPGAYVVTADREGSLRQERSVTLDGEPSVEVTLALP
jgi:protocatechuate 3,4-dioxygenase beta subunit